MEIRIIKAFRLRICVSCFLLLLIQQASADLSYVDLKGVDEIVGNHPALNPAYGYLQIDVALANRRFFGNYGSKRIGISCLENASRIHQMLVEKNDCPQDAMSEWIQRLFPSQDGVNFVANQIHSDPISSLPPKAIGEILGKIADTPDESWGKDERIKTLQSQLSEIFFRNVNPHKYCLKTFRDRETAVANYLSSSAAEKGKKEKVILELNALLEAILGPLPPQFSKTAAGKFQNVNQTLCNTLQKGEGRSDDFKDIARILTSALKESRLPFAHYPKYLPEQALLGFFIKKATHGKDDLINLFEGMRSKLSSHGRLFLDTDGAKEAFRRSKFQEYDYHKADWESHPETAASRFAQEPSLLIFAVMHEKLDEKELPPILTYKSVSDGKLRYPDCGETAIRNFFNILVFDEGKFDSSILQRLKAPASQGEIYRPLREFYEHYSDPAHASTQQAHDAWSQVVRGHSEQEISYLKGEKLSACEIDVGVDNTVKVIENLIFHGALMNPLREAKSRAERLDELCKAVSRKGKELNWKVAGSKSEGDSKEKLNLMNTGVMIQFSINRKPAFEWYFGAGHFVFQTLDHRKCVSWKDKIVHYLPREVREGANPIVLNPFVSESIFQELARVTSLENSVYALPLSTDESKLFAFQQIVSAPKEQALAMRPLADQIRSKLPEKTDLHTLRQIHEALADAGMPYDGDTVHPIGNPDVTYTRVNPRDPIMIEKFGEYAAQTMRQGWRREMFGHPVVIGELLLDEEGCEKKLNFAEAKNACLDLNPVNHRSKVEASFKKREEALHSVRVKYKAKLGYGRESNLSPEEQQDFQTILENPVQGCYLPSREELMVLMQDFSYRDQRYVPQILPRLNNREIWSSSEDPRNPGVGFTFGGIGVGHIIIHYTRSPAFVRCVCASAVW